MIKYTLLFSFFLSTIFGMENHALLIGIGEYSAQAKKENLKGDLDARKFKNTLIGIGFSSSSIDLLQNEQATKPQIIEAFNKLNQKIKKGDIVIIYYSGHGEQIIDDDIDPQKSTREEVDGKDESIVCYHGENIIDDDIQTFLTRIRQNLGADGQLIVFFDCCFSGTMARGVKEEINNKAAFEEFKINALKDEAELFFFSAVASYAKSEQIGDKGAFTQALIKALSYKLLTYNDLYAKIQEEISQIPNSPKAYYKLPNFEGNGNAKIFGVGRINQDLFFEIDKIQFDDSSKIIINGGRLAGVFEKSEISLYPTGTHSSQEANPIVKGVVELTDNFSATIKLQNKLTRHIKSVWAFVTKPAFENYKTVILSATNDSILLSKYIKKYNLLSLTTKTGGGQLSVFIDNSKIRLLNNIGLEEIASNNNIDTVLTVAQKFARASIFKKIESVKNPDYQIKVELIPVSQNTSNIRDSLSRDVFFKSNIPTFDTTMNVIIKVTNVGKDKCYFSLVNVSSNGDIQTILPSENRLITDLLLDVGKSFVSDEVLGVVPPFGDEILIGFASKKPLNLSPILNNTFSANRAVDSPLETLINDVYAGTRSPSNINSKNIEAGIYKYFYRIAPK